MNSNCPICGKVDQCQKVSSVVQGGTSSGSFSGPSVGLTYSNGKMGYAGGYTTLSGISSTNLAQILTQPVKPEPRGLGWQKFGLVIFYVLLVSAVMLGFGFMFNSETAGAGFGVLILEGGLFLFIIRAISKSRKSNEKWNIEEFPKVLAEWQRKMVIYDSLYYCHRDDTVFDPNNGNHVPPKDMEKLLIAGKS